MTINKIIRLAIASTALLSVSMIPTSALADTTNCESKTICVTIGIITVCVDVEVCDKEPNRQRG